MEVSEQQNLSQQMSNLGKGRSERPTFESIEQQFLRSEGKKEPLIQNVPEFKTDALQKTQEIKIDFYPSTQQQP